MTLEEYEVRATAVLRVRRNGPGDEVTAADVLARDTLALVARVRELEAALRPFADDWSEWGIDSGSVYVRADGDDPDGDLARFRVEDLRRASQILGRVNSSE